MSNLIMTNPVDAMIGDTLSNFACRDADIPLFRFGFPIFDWVNKHASGSVTRLFAGYGLCIMVVLATAVQGECAAAAKHS